MSQTELERGVGEVLIDEDRLQERIRELGRELSSDYAGRELLLVGVLKGAGMRCPKAGRPNRTDEDGDRAKRPRARRARHPIPDRFAVGRERHVEEHDSSLHAIALGVELLEIVDDQELRLDAAGGRSDTVAEA